MICSCCGKHKKPVGLEDMGTALKPAMELIAVARKPLSESTIAKNILRWGTGAINVGACRIEGDERKTQTGGTGRKANPVYGAFANADTEALTTTEGRWPANLAHDNSDEVLAAFPESKGQLAAVGPQHGAKSSVNVYGDYGPRDFTPPRNDPGSAARFFYSAKASKADRALSKHPTVKPVKLMQWLVRLITPHGGTTLDPFAGTGTTGEAAWREGMRAVLIEREEEYQADIERRMLFARARPKEESTAARKPKRDCDPGTLDMFPLESVVASQATNGVDA